MLVCRCVYRPDGAAEFYSAPVEADPGRSGQLIPFQTCSLSKSTRQSVQNRGFADCSVVSSPWWFLRVRLRRNRSETASTRSVSALTAWKQYRNVECRSNRHWLGSESNAIDWDRKSPNTLPNIFRISGRNETHLHDVRKLLMKRSTPAAVLTVRNGSGRARTVASRARTALTSAVRTGLYARLIGFTYASHSSCTLLCCLRTGTAACPTSAPEMLCHLPF